MCIRDRLKQTADREDIYMRIVVEKYHGLGNDYLVYDPNKNKLKLTPSNVQLMCNRNFGVGADGILAVSYTHLRLPLCRGPWALSDML